jgi:hypothetical protein
VGAGSLWPPNPTNANAFFVGVGWMGWWFQGCCKNLVGLLKYYYFSTKISKLGGKKKEKGYLNPLRH